VDRPLRPGALFGNGSDLAGVHGGSSGHRHPTWPDDLSVAISVRSRGTRPHCTRDARWSGPGVGLFTLDVLLQKGKMDSLSKELRHVREAVQTAHADVRENILSLRTTLAHETGLVSAMVEYIDEFSIQTGIEVQFLNRAGDELELSSIAEVQLVCILQEALTNVRKHSQAAHVDVQIAREDGNTIAATGYIPSATSFIHMTVGDDGMGFDLNTSRRSFGLQTMRERAQSVGGDLEVTSCRGKGTQVELRLPCVDQEAVKKRSLVLS
jgi:signal transduction histidine kinase